MWGDGNKISFLEGACTLVGETENKQDKSVNYTRIKQCQARGEQREETGSGCTGGRGGRHRAVRRSTLPRGQLCWGLAGASLFRTQAAVRGEEVWGLQPGLGARKAGGTFCTADRAAGVAPRWGEGGGGEAPLAPRRPPFQFTPPGLRPPGLPSLETQSSRVPCPLCLLAHVPRQPQWSLRMPWTSSLRGCHLDKV